MAHMDADKARRDLEEARQSYSSAVQPQLPRWAPPVCGLLVWAAMALAGYSPSPGWLKALAILVGVLLALAAAAVVFGFRARQGVVGLRGPAREQWTTVLTACVAVLVCALGASPDLRWIFAGAGLVAGVYTWLTLRGKVRS